MKDYSECLINIREFLRRTEECLQAKNAIGAVHHAMNAVNETQDLLDIAIDGTREDE
jgi:hypothetical protein